MPRALYDLHVVLPRGIKRAIEKRWYEFASRMDRDADMLFMNYGWADLDPEAGAIDLRNEDEPNRYCIQLYHHVAGAVDLTGSDVLEVGSGRGGGASYMARYLNPRRVVGVDLTDAAIRFCNGHYRIPNLSFVRGDAESLPFDDESFHAVVNIESSHCYRSMERFLGGVRRVLKPGGHFLFADHRPKEQIDALRGQLDRYGLTALEEQRITPNIVRALERDSARKVHLIRRKVPRILRGVFRGFAGIPGTGGIYGRFNDGDWEYVSFMLRK